MPRKKQILDLSTNKALREFYHHYNRIYFGSKLPENVMIYFGTPPRKDAAFVDLQGHDADRVVEIILDETLRGMDCVVAWLVIHEMAHVDIEGNDDGKEDGPKHNKRMLELARAGALEGIW